MAKYNLINNGIIYSLTSSGTGNKSLSYSQLSSLIDGNTTSSGVLLSTSDNLYLEADLGNRIKIHDIRLYLEDLNILDNIDFYYKNEETDSYTICSKGVTTDYYYATIPDISAPQIVLVTISGVDTTIYEYKILNNDYIVGFGEDGSASGVYLEQTPMGQESNPYSVAIYNNSTSQYPADAYVVVDITGTVADSYVTISTTEDGTYYGVTDGITITDNNVSSRYTWNKGTFDNVSVVNDTYLQITSVTASTALANRLSVIPASFVGISGQPWLYDSTDNAVYSVHYDGDLKLYKYDLTTYTWTYISWLPTTSTGFSTNLVTMAKAGNYVYLTFSADETSATWFGRYDLTGAQGNFTWLAPSAQAGIIQNGGVSMIYGGNGYIYYAFGAYYTTGVLLRYEIASNTWTQLANPAPNYNSSGTIRATLLADTVRNCLYFLVGRSTIGTYVQKYDMSSNTWNTTWFDYSTRLGSDYDYLNMSYYDGKLYFAENSYGPVVYVYDIVTDTVSNILIDYTMNSTNSAKILTIPPQGTDDTITLLLSNIYGDTTGLYGYNINSSMFYIQPEVNSGTYTTPIFDIGNPYMASYFNVVETTASGYSMVSKTTTASPGTIEVRSSNSTPLPVIQVFWPYSNANNYLYWIVFDINTGVSTVYSKTETVKYPKQVAVDWRRNRKAFSYVYGSSGVNDNFMCVIKPDNTGILYSTTDAWTDEDYNYFAQHIEYSYDGKIWGWSASGLQAFAMDLTSRLYRDSSITSIGGMSATYDVSGVWCVDRTTAYEVVHISTDYTQLASITSLTNPYAVAASENGACWVSDISDLKIYKFSSDGTQLKSVYVGDTLYTMTRDFLGGFFARGSQGAIYHFDSAGTMDMHVTITDATSLRGCPYGCIVYEDIQKRAHYIDLATKTVLYVITCPSVTGQVWGRPDIFWCDLESDQTNYTELGSTSMLPITSDPVWGTSGSLTWTEVPKNGYFLPKERYQQARLTLTSLAKYTNPKVHSVTIPAPIRVTDLGPQSSRDIYVKTAIPSDADLTAYTARLKAWWDVQE